MAHLHILGVAGSFMAGLARLAVADGHTVSGSDNHFYPPFGEQARLLKATLFEGYDGDCAQRPADLYLVGNAVSRGNPLMESILRRRLPYISGPQWLYENVLRTRRVIAVAGTHGKTTTAALLVHLLDRAGIMPGFLLGGVYPALGVSSRLSPQSPWFVIEADEYDSAFFDKRPKFLHYHPQIAVLNNLDFDHADIYPDVDAIILQFHYLLRTMPDNAAVIARGGDKNLAAAIGRGAYSPIQWFGDSAASEWHWRLDGSAMQIIHADESVPSPRFPPPLPGAANRDNICAAAAAAVAAGVDRLKIGDYLQEFQPPLRRLQHLFTCRGVRVFDDFAHHPTAIKKTIAALAEQRRTRLVAVFEPRSNSMKAGVFRRQLAAAVAAADIVVAVGDDWLNDSLAACAQPVFVEAAAAAAAARLATITMPGDDVLLMSNGDFGGLQQLLKTALAAGHPASNK